VTDPMVAAARHMLDRCVADMRPALEGASVEALNWRPAGEETNSIGILAVHAMGSSRTWLSVAVGAPEPERDREAEFRTDVRDPAELLATFDRLVGECRAALATEEDIDWSGERTPSRRPGSAPDVITAGWTLLHALEHLREHVAHLQLTRQLWDAQTGGE
jgi:uncharacterized damage-inducible protein DinB